MKFKMTNRRVLTSPLIDGIVLIEGEMFDDGMFRLIAPPDIPPNVVKALEDAVREVDGYLGRRAWLSDLISATTNERGE